MQVDLLSSAQSAHALHLFTNIPSCALYDQRCGANLYCQYLAGARCIASDGYRNQKKPVILRLSPVRC